MPHATYDRPTKATLHVHLDNGEQWEATDADLNQFRLITRHDAYMAVNKALTDILVNHGLINRANPDEADGCRELTDTQINPLRYLVEAAICYPDLLDHPEHRDWVSVADVERALRVPAAREVAASNAD